MAKQSGKDVRVIAYCDRATERLMRKYRRLLERGVAKNKCVAAVARELACFIWGLMNDKLDGRSVGGNAKAQS
jgi:transposase